MGFIQSPDDQSSNKKHEHNDKTVKEDLAIVQCGTKNDMPKRFIDNIGKYTADCNKDNDSLVMKEFVENETDNEANHKMAHEQHVSVYSVTEIIKDMFFTRSRCISFANQ